VLFVLTGVMLVFGILAARPRMLPDETAVSLAGEPAASSLAGETGPPGGSEPAAGRSPASGTGPGGQTGPAASGDGRASTGGAA
jgi:serine/threonine-protein kinase PknG